MEAPAKLSDLTATADSLESKLEGIYVRLHRMHIIFEELIGDLPATVASAAREAKDALNDAEYLAETLPRLRKPRRAKGGAA